MKYKENDFIKIIDLEMQGYTLKSLDVGEKAYKVADKPAKYLEVLY